MDSEEEGEFTGDQTSGYVLKFPALFSGKKRRDKGITLGEEGSARN